MANLTPVVANMRPLEPSIVLKGQAAAGVTAIVGQIVYKNADGEWAVADASAAATSKGLIGVVVATARALSTGTCLANEELSVLVYGRVTGWSDALDETVDYYLSNDAGQIADAAGTVSRFLGHPESSTVFFFDPIGIPTSA